MNKSYINGVGCISAQNTFGTDFLDEFMINDSLNVLFAMQPSYKEVIPPAAIRRMAKGVKMGIYASNSALKEANCTVPDAIITGTGMGCVEDSEKFLKGIIDNKEQFLTPTSFIQSTHNTVGAQIALGMQCKGYNFTYVNGAVSFESALLDAKLQLENQEANSILVGGIDETSEHTLSLYKLINLLKNDEDRPFTILDSNSKGVVFGEGASFFVLENKPTDNSYAVIENIAMINQLNEDEVEGFIKQFLEANKLDSNDIDVVVLGNNGDNQYDHFYNSPKTLFNAIPQVYYKHLCGEFNTASTFGFWVAAKILKNQFIPEVLLMNNMPSKEYEFILLYNQYCGKDHSLILLKNVKK